MSDLCPLCLKHPLPSLDPSYSHFRDVNCEWCGHYRTNHDVPQLCKNKYAAVIWKLAAYVREKTLQGVEVVLFPAQNEIPPDAPRGSVGLDQALESFPKSVAERFDRILLNLERMTTHLGTKIGIEYDSKPLLMAQNNSEVDFLMASLTDLGYVVGYFSRIACVVTLTAKGLERAADLVRGLYGPLSKQAFVAMSFDKTLDAAWMHGLKLGIEEDCGYTAFRVDNKEHNEKICDLIIAEIRKSKFLVADFSLHRGGVYFEAGMMLGLGRPVIFTCREDQLKDAHFDTRQYSHIVWKTPEELREKLKRRIQATIAP